MVGHLAGPYRQLLDPDLVIVRRLSPPRMQSANRQPHPLNKRGPSSRPPGVTAPRLGCHATAAGSNAQKAPAVSRRQDLVRTPNRAFSYGWGLKRIMWCTCWDSFPTPDFSGRLSECWTRDTRRATIVAMSTESLRTVRDHLSEMVDRVEQQHERLVVTRNGRPAAVLISPDDLAEMEETISVLSDSEALADIREADAAYARGDVVRGINAVRDLRR